MSLTKRACEDETMGAWKHLRAIILLPGLVLFLIPGIILWRGGLDTLGLWQSAPASRVILPALGGICLGLDLVLLAATARLFGTVGQGTLAPWDPPQRLVVRGIYYYSAGIQNCHASRTTCFVEMTYNHPITFKR